MLNLRYENVTPKSRYFKIFTFVPTGIIAKISLISSSFKATHPSVQSLAVPPP